jgi:hypothetical protein
MPSISARVSESHPGEGEPSMRTRNSDQWNCATRSRTKLISKSLYLYIVIYLVDLPGAYWMVRAKVFESGGLSLSPIAVRQICTAIRMCLRFWCCPGMRRVCGASSVMHQRRECQLDHSRSVSQTASPP